MDRQSCNDTSANMRQHMITPDMILATFWTYEQSRHDIGNILVLVDFQKTSLIFWQTLPPTCAYDTSVVPFPPDTTPLRFLQFLA